MEVHKNYFSPYIAALCHNLAELLPGDLNYSFFPNSGAEAVDAAMRAAYKYHNIERTHILFSNISNSVNSIGFIFGLNKQLNKRFIIITF